ncbi:DUF6263 family protein [bacterium]|jgi:hypothetical protein|nr:DUF6263 family protein [bacterium]MDB2347012.1 DUF6263 family protein [Verrucomicrobiales bacterium]MDB2327332.1 DUF6263 family protein [bacterium]MDB4507600.1 DUF6263 family protein [bacterium]MDB4772706.1 DUF6263 family protein [Verrucomicrobiales bacterium]
MKSNFLVPASAILATCALTFSVSAEEKTIKLKQALPAGKKIHQSMVMNQKMKMGGAPGAPAGGMNITNKMTIGMSMDINKHEEKKKRMILKYEEISMAVDTGLFPKQEFSSKDPEGPFKGLADHPVTLIYDEKDQIVSVEGADELVDGAENQPVVGEMLKQILGEDQLKQTMNQMMVQMIPDKVLKIGDSWPYEMKVPMPQGMGEMTMKGKYTLKKFEKFEGHDCAVLTMVGGIDSDEKVKMETNGQQVEIEFKDSQFEADIYFDNKLGLTRKTNMLTMMNMAMTIPALGMNMTMDMNMTMTSKVTKVEDSK